MIFSRLSGSRTGSSGVMAKLTFDTRLATRHRPPGMIPQGLRDLVCRGCVATVSVIILVPVLPQGLRDNLKGQGQPQAANMYIRSI